MINLAKIKSFSKEILIGIVFLFIISNLLSYLRQPELKSEKLSLYNARLIDNSVFEIKKDKPILIHFWATWCGACKMEAPNIDVVSKEYEVLTFVVKSGENHQIQSYMDKNQFTYHVVNDKDGRIAREFNIKAFPTTFIYNAKKELKFTEVGYTSTFGLFGRLKLL